MSIRFAVAALFITLAIVIYLLSTFGIFKYRYVLNRMHIAAQSDTLGFISLVIGVIILIGPSFAALKLILLVVFFWFIGPMTSHVVARIELAEQEEEDEEQFKVEKRYMEEEDVR